MYRVGQIHGTAFFLKHFNHHTRFCMAQKCTGVVTCLESILGIIITSNMYVQLLIVGYWTVAFIKQNDKAVKQSDLTL